MKVSKFSTAIFTTGMWLFTIAGCTDSPLGGDEISPGTREIHGNVVLMDGSSPEGVYVWLDGFKIGTRTDGNGDFKITLPPRAAQGAGGVSGVFRLYFYLANYLLSSSSVVTQDGAFVYSKGDIDKNGGLSDPQELKRFLEISMEVEPSSVAANFSGPVDVDVSLRTTVDSAIVDFPPSLGRPLGAIILREIGSEDFFVFQSIVGDSRSEKMVIGFVPKIKTMVFTLIGGVLPPGDYEVIPHMLISHEPIPADLLASLGMNFEEPGSDYLNIPIKRQGGRFKVTEGGN